MVKIIINYNKKRLAGFYLLITLLLLVFISFYYVKKSTLTGILVQGSYAINSNKICFNGLVNSKVYHKRPSWVLRKKGHVGVGLPVESGVQKERVVGGGVLFG